MRRRTFAKALAVGTTLTASGVSLNTLAALLQPCSSSAGFSCAGFKQLVGSSFTLTAYPGEKLELFDVETANASHPDEQFYLSFRTRSGNVLQEGIHKLLDESGEYTALWLSPSQSRKGIMEAVINLQSCAG